MLIIRFCQVILGSLLCGVALLLPYRPRLWYMKSLSATVHAPYYVFGRIVRYLMDKLHIDIGKIYGKS